MKIGVMGAGLGGMGFEKALDYCKHLGLDTIELPVGGYPGKPFFDPEEVLKSTAKQNEIKDAVKKRGLTVSALAVHGNAVHPDPAIAKEHQAAHETAVKLAPKLGTNIVITFSGCPGGAKGDKTPNWVTCPWPTDFENILTYQWNDVLIPFWTKQNKLAADQGVKIAFEAHPGFSVYNTETLLKIRKTCGKQLGANFDPSHFFWQGMDPIESARVLGAAKCIFHVHAKDTAIDPNNSKINGNLDTKSYGDIAARSWVFRTVGYGHGDEFWKPFVSMLRTYGYDGPLSIEHEDGLMSIQEGFEKAVNYLKTIIIREKAGQAWWF
ncbi:MAG: sugar phosphate isomerase/epimerase [Phycisphaerae bacterium]|jgi:sugar phosphate isomerase/epimerase|nr:sugar phosphate isomerase/epimerase [Phycisphaerae bacterium]